MFYAPVHFFDITGVSLLLLGGLLIAMAIRRWTGKWFQRVCSQVSDLPSTCGSSGRDVAVRLLEASDLGRVPVMSTGRIDCYHPWKRQIRLRLNTYSSTSLSALAIAAHEVGHAQQFAERIWRCRLRNVLWPICWALPFLAILLAASCIIGDVDLSGFSLGIGILVSCALVVVLQLPITLPLERDASRRALKLASENGLLAKHEEAAFLRVLDSAWKTHASAEAQRWIVLVSIAVVVGVAPLYRSLVNPAAALLSAYEAPEPAVSLTPPLVAQPNLATRSPSSDQPDRVDFGDALDPWDAIPSMMLGSPLFLLFAYIVLAVAKRTKQTNPKNLTREAKAMLRNNAASTLHARGQYQAAIDEYSSAIRLNPKMTAAWYNRGQTYVTLGRYEEAVSDLDTAAGLAPHYLDAIAARGQVRLLLGRHDLGIADLEEVLTQNPTNLNALAVQSDFCQRQGNLDRAISIWSDAIEAAPENAVFYRTRGLMHYFHENHECAIRDQTNAIRLDPSDAIARNNRGAALIKLGEWNAAVDDLRSAIQLDPKLPNSFRHLAWVQATCPDPEYRDGAEAVINATRALELSDWKKPEWYEVLAAACAEAGSFSQAIHWQQKCLDESDSKPEWEERLKLYQSGEPFRESPVSQSPATAQLELQATP